MEPITFEPTNHLEQ